MLRSDPYVTDVAVVLTAPGEHAALLSVLDRIGEERRREEEVKA